ncbi:hypothetical protein RHSIM_Rhsim01G0125100 [Rhododendron simsii]|uniref:Uncharacterized protein n=1 Tax=Rhododendron simsii TaxID=118357 RepID=A0A834HV39_RHOSS|nr:hypothetical protein RHSIM_Rhsim01G0125100 [Rhododendron simsii]
MFSVSNKTIHRIWSRAKVCEAHDSMVDVSSKKRRRVGQKQCKIDWKKVRGIAFHCSTNIHSFSKALEVPKSMLHQRIKEGEIRPHTNPLKPDLSDQNKIARLHFCLSMLEPNNLQTQPMFKAMYNYVHIDEKWFYMTKELESRRRVPKLKCSLMNYDWGQIGSESLNRELRGFFSLNSGGPHRGRKALCRVLDGNSQGPLFLVENSENGVLIGFEEIITGSGVRV